ncbi:hypothetical protein [Francisella orientalis]|uniref:Lipoprotein n=1 Tax=Francisella orientalis TaxID=299583 RepID=A0AAP6XBH1_9GAMM|nr:hypothetical protein [Francisella orientalis]AFJ43971.1 hypothetical protein OOM_1590 [Francisella orientalis str. Toba 04]AHB98613.1 hypothetical protein M973_07130 [Francisella orientalis LADL 07-285A]AKN85860.1 hypothetical protein FNO12_1278 [Francisella orientalis FNO12]AKN87399.1 Hypothetical protein FNO24_1280 [Francisella orientalis FNO24]AKN88936.1 Hypothetical protein FNO190_1278 [Francisella orientalis]
MKYLKIIVCIMSVVLLGACSNEQDTSSASSNASIKSNFKDMGDSIGDSAKDVTKSIGHDSRNIVDGN